MHVYKVLSAPSHAVWRGDPAVLARSRRSTAAGAGVGDGGTWRGIDPLDQKKIKKNTKNLLTIAVTCAIIVSAKGDKRIAPAAVSSKGE